MLGNRFPIDPPIAPMLAQLAAALPDDEELLFEPKWDGFRAIVFRGEDTVYIQSRDLRPLDRYFPELHDALIAGVPPRCVLDGEIVIATDAGLASGSLLQADAQLVDASLALQRAFQSRRHPIPLAVRHAEHVVQVDPDEEAAARGG